MESAAPYADTPIPLYLGSVTGMRYRTLNCMECGREFLERNNETIYRIGDESQPGGVAISAEPVAAICSNCRQHYTVQISLTISFDHDGVPLYMQPESMYLAVEEHKKLRYVHCLECGHVFQSISDRISQVIDNRVPFQYLNPSKLGPIERTCTANTCGQAWAVMV